jgi:hypothetical protein
MAAATWGSNDDRGCPPAIHLEAGGPESTVQAPWRQPEDDGRLRHRLLTADLRQKLTSPVHIADDWEEAEVTLQRHTLLPLDTCLDSLQAGKSI